MSRQIDLSKPLSDEDRAYLESRNRLTDIALAEGGDASSLTAGPSLSSTATPEELLEQTPNLGDVGTVQKNYTEGDGTAPDPTEYDDMTVQQLKDELERRDLPVSGNKSELIARLVEDDDDTE